MQLLLRPVVVRLLLLLLGLLQHLEVRPPVAAMLRQGVPAALALAQGKIPRQTQGQQQGSLVVQLVVQLQLHCWSVHASASS